MYPLLKNCFADWESPVCIKWHQDQKSRETPVFYIFTRLCKLCLPAHASRRLSELQPRACGRARPHLPTRKKHILHSFRGEKSQSHNWLCIAGIFVRGAKKKTFKIFDLFWVRFCSLGLTSCPQGGEARRQLVLLGQGKAASKIQK